MFQIEDVIRIHGRNSHQENRIMLSMDGVSESKSTTISLDVYSLKFEGCRDIYPLKIIRPLQKGFVNFHEQFISVLNAVIAAELVIQALIADNPKRAFLRYSLQHSAKCACEYCFESGISCKDANADTVQIVQKIHQQKIALQEQIDFFEESNDTVSIQTLKDVMKNLEAAEGIAKKKNLLILSGQQLLLMEKNEPRKNF